VIGGPSRPQSRKRWSSKRAWIGPVRTPTSSGHAAAAPAARPASPAHRDVVVDEAHELGVGGVTRVLRAALRPRARVVAQVARAVALGSAARRLVGPVVDHEHLGAGRARLRAIDASATSR
jgi:hypothetical protein